MTSDAWERRNGIITRRSILRSMAASSAIILPRSVMAQGVPGLSYALLGGNAPPVIGTPVAIGKASALSMTTTGNILAGDLVIVCVGAIGGGSVTAVTDGTNVYTKAVEGVSGGGLCSIWYKANALAVGSGATITAVNPSASDPNIGAARCVITPTPTLDKTNTALSTASVASGALSFPNELIIGGVGGDNFTSVTESAGFTNLVSNENGATQVWVNFGYKIVTNNSSVTYAPTLGGGPANYVTAIATFY